MKDFIEAISFLSSMDKELIHIITVTLKMSFISTTLSCLIGMPLGAIIVSNDFKGKNIIKIVLNTLIGLPPVVAGLIVYMIFTHYGPLGFLDVLFSVKAMVIAQILLITPIVSSLTISVLSVKTSKIKENSIGMGLQKNRIRLLLITENKKPILSIALTAFGRSIAEVGAVSLVGGNIQWKTRVLTTAILLETNKGNFKFALALGIVLLIIALIVNVIASLFIKEDVKND